MSSEEEILLSQADADALARSVFNQKDPLPRVKHSLLSAEDIKKYVMKTGLISPFYVDPDNRRLKKASYEGRIGKKAFKYNSEGDLSTIDLGDNKLVVPANSIVFVEPDVQFRLPPYIALRYNLQIKHVHRGLLLGTGPLVDPGYWGTLCIPLHNLTSEDYVIPLSEGLIWIEFTKTTDLGREGRSPLQSPDAGDQVPKGNWDIEKFIRKAAKPFDPNLPAVAIRSSIPDVGVNAQTAAEGAERAARGAEGRADEARSDALNAKKEAESAKRFITTFSVIGMIALVASFVGLGFTFYFGLRADVAAMSARIDAMETPVATATAKTAALDDGAKSKDDEIKRLAGELKLLTNRLDKIIKDNALVP